MARLVVMKKPRIAQVAESMSPKPPRAMVIKGMTIALSGMGACCVSVQSTESTMPLIPTDNGPVQLSASCPSAFNSSL